MSSHSDEEVRSRLRRAFAEEPAPKGFRHLLVLWRFPHLEPNNQSWTFMSSLDSGDGLLRLAVWDRFTSPNPIWISDIELTPDELLEAFEVFGRFEILADQAGGIYDGARYGRDLYDEHSGELEESIDWIHGDTFGAFENDLSDSLRDKMLWSAVPYSDDVLNRIKC